MNKLKTYEQVDKLSEAVSFRISKMEQIYESRNGQPDEPHRHNYYTVILVIKADGKHLIDFNEYPLSGNQIHFVSPGQVHQIVEHKKSFGYALLFSNQFLIENNIPLSFIDDLNLFNDYGQSPHLQISTEQLKKFTNYCEEIFNWSQSALKFKEQAIGAFLKLFLIETNNLNIAPNNHAQNIEAGNSILKKFKELVNKNYSQWHSTSEYAQKLNITPDHLNRSIKFFIGRSAKEYIQNRIIIAAKRILYFSELSSKEIGFELGFDEASNFSAFFKKHTGKSPSQFRKNQ